jgi:hypothetical protein
MIAASLEQQEKALPKRVLTISEEHPAAAE